MDDSDAELMARLAAGDDLSLNALMQRWGDRITAFLLRMTGRHDVALDLAQETFVKLYQARARYRPTASFSTYLFAIASNLARNHARWKSRHPTVSLDDDGPHGITHTPEDSRELPDQSLLSRETVRAVQDAFLTLPLDLREPMTLLVHEGMSYAEIAGLVGCSVKAVENRIYRARQLLRERLGGLRA
jgi:RNA polymerase sigma-70 factor (ECF subfamily)